MRDVTYPAPGLVSVGDDTFSYAVPPPPGNPHGTPPIYKSLVLLEQLEQLLGGLSPRRILELGIYRGGSVALIAAVAEPEKFVAIELSASEQQGLTKFLEERGFEQVVPYYGLDQSDPAIVDVLDDEFGTEAIDLVIDDASHLYEPTRKSFEMIFPRVRPGGVYVIEDWAAQHTLLATVVDNIIRRRNGWETQLEKLADQLEGVDVDLASELRASPTAANVRAAARSTARVAIPQGLSRVGLEIVHLAAESRDIVRSIEFTQGWIEITRGEGEISGESWLSDGSLDLFGSLSKTTTAGAASPR